MNHQIQPRPARTYKKRFPSSESAITLDFVALPGRINKLRRKRLFDIVFSLIVIVFLLSWLLPILALLIKMDSRGPIFFIQRRVGAFGKIFWCIKLRTMVINEEANSRQAQKNDPRITPFGNFLRLSCMDELPQFFNVLLGDMSIVGPRPHMLRDCREFSSVVKNYHHRNFVKPGITGMAQVKGYRGKTDCFFDVAHRYKWDMFYVNNCSFNLDMRIIRTTIVSTLTAIFSFQAKGKPSQKLRIQIDRPEYLN
jgi:putative colanic acid biosynthesis UDP-glucose lipid carrier transferase